MAEETIELPAEPASAARAREFVRDRVRRSRHGSLEDPALLCVTELVANVSLHTDSPQCVVTVREAPEAITIEVTDDAGQLPSMGPASSQSEHGRGLRIVDALAREWGVRRRADRRKSVWVRLSEGSYAAGPGPTAN